MDCDVREQKVGIILNGSDTRLEFDVRVRKSQFKTSWNKNNEIMKEPKLLRNLILASQIQQLMDKGQVEGLRQAAQWLHISQSRLHHILSLLLLSPSIQSEILDGDPRKIDLMPEYKMLSIAAEFNWDTQTQLWRELKHS